MQSNSLTIVKTISAIVLLICATTLVGAEELAGPIQIEPAISPTENIAPNADIAETAVMSAADDNPVEMETVNWDCLLLCFEKRGECMIHCNSNLACMEQCTEDFMGCKALCE